jgi:hypothetical protein
VHSCRPVGLPRAHSKARRLRAGFACSVLFMALRQPRPRRDLLDACPVQLPARELAGKCGREGVQKAHYPPASHVAIRKTRVPLRHHALLTCPHTARRAKESSLDYTARRAKESSLDFRGKASTPSPHGASTCHTRSPRGRSPAAALHDNESRRRGLGARTTCSQHPSNFPSRCALRGCALLQRCVWRGPSRRSVKGAG